MKNILSSKDSDHRYKGKKMNEKKESTSKKLGRFLGKKAVNAGNIINREITKAGKVAREEFKDFDIGNVVVEPIKRHRSEESRVQFTRRVRPTKTYTQANRTVQFFSRNPDKKEMNPGIDGMVSFSILITPIAFLLGVLIIFLDFDILLAILLFFLYMLFVAIPGAYLGLDAIFTGARSVITGGTATVVAISRGFLEFCYLMIRGLGELALLVFSGLFGFLRGTFDTVADYIVFFVVYALSAASLWAISILINLPTIIQDTPRLAGYEIIVLGFIILLPALLPASIAHRYWLLWKLDRQSPS